MATESMSREAALRAWASAQGFAGKAAGTHDVLTERTWLRTLGGADPYFALFARGVPLERAAIDAATLDGKLRVTPAVRGCMYMVADTHADLALAIADQHSRKRSAQDLVKAGGTAKQLGKTAKAVLAALESEGRTTAELRKAVAKSIVSFGDQGKKVGLSSSLPPALRQLEFDGEIERTPVDGRLDTETYRWSLRTRTRTRHASADANRAIAALFFAHHSPASFDHFVAWSGLTKGAARAALAELELVHVDVEDHEGVAQPMLSTPAALELAHAKSERAASVALLGLQDLYLVVHDGPGWACPAAHLDLEIPRWGPMRAAAIRATKHPHLRAIVVDGELAGFWDVNAAMDQQHLAWFEAPSKTVERAAAKQVQALRGFMAEQLGHAKTFSIDSDAKIDARFELVEGLI